MMAPLATMGDTMKKLAATMMFASLATITGPATAQPGAIESYTARLSSQDHFNSSGQRLRTVAGILRQDRANVHRFGRADGEDEGDRYFSSATNRAALENLILRGHVTRAAANAIINGEPLVRVTIYRGYVDVTVF